MQNVAILSLLTLMINSTASGQPQREKGVLILTADTVTNTRGYRDEAGKMVIPFGQYSDCYTDTFRTYATVFESGRGVVAIDRQLRVLYNVFIFDNGPDYPEEGLFRIKVAGKIGYADSASGRIVVKPLYACAYPFENGKAKVALNCKTRAMGEHSTWDSDEWFYINNARQRVKASAK